MTTHHQSEPNAQPASEPASVMPVFAIKAKDNFATTAICAYYAACICHGFTEQANQVEMALREIMDWREANRGKCKFPDHNHAPAGSEGSGSEHAVAGLVEKWRAENGDYPEAKRDCADELAAALAGGGK
jgi:hypothetical protein